MVSKQNPALCISKRGDAFIAAMPKHIAANIIRIVFSIGFLLYKQNGRKFLLEELRPVDTQGNALYSIVSILPLTRHSLFVFR